MILDLNIPNHAYLFGFIQADGHLYAQTRQRGRLTVEISERDRPILEAFASMIPVKSFLTCRERITNFGPITTVIWRINDLAFRRELVALGLPYGKKSQKVGPPLVYSAHDFFRGWLDADGSVGLTAKGRPFLSLVTSSEAIPTAYIAFVTKITGLKKVTSGNRRDGVFNIAMFCETAIKVISTVYYGGCLALPRKLLKVTDALAWSRPTSSPTYLGRQEWNEIEDQIVLSNSVNDAMRLLTRTEKSVRIRRWRLQYKSLQGD